ncbi:MAG TPA: polysaccharide deacetylase family protein [Tissierellales bacterium]|nr:polysaccharide deacetylase family protein [Tissierellales bacterium]
MRIYKKRFTVFVIIFSVIILFSGIKIGEVLASKMLDKPNNEELKKSEVKGVEEVKEKVKKEEKKEIEKKKEEKEKLEQKKNKEAENKKENKKNKEKMKEEKNKKESENKSGQGEKKGSAKKEKIAYLTFDDGPSRNVTPQILDILREYDVKATFFVTGIAAEDNRDIIKRAYSEGHAIGNHSYSHNYKYLYSNLNNFLIDMKKNEDILKDILGSDFEVKLARLPGGSYGEKKSPYNRAIEKKGYKSIDWNALTGDAEGHHIPKDRLVQKLKNTSKGKDEVIVLMHDLGTKQTTASALPEIIEYLKNEGYEFRVLN